MKIYARVVCGEIVADCEIPKNDKGYSGEAVDMVRACADQVVKIIKAKASDTPAPKAGKGK